ncbi:MAG: hypothetical protein MR355_00460 [Lachnospiraceae bacterium]|nr:hypothetical protein [Lachnospiraceae bacterium]
MKKQRTLQEEQYRQAQKKRNLEAWTMAAFAMSIMGLPLSCLGIIPFIFVDILEFVLGVRGLKSSHRGMAIATIVISLISAVMIAAVNLIYLFRVAA